MRECESVSLNVERVKEIDAWEFVCVRISSVCPWMGEERGKDKWWAKIEKKESL